MSKLRTFDIFSTVKSHRARDRSYFNIHHHDWMSTYSNKSKTLPPALSNAGSARGSHRPPPAPKSVKSNQTRKSHRNTPSRMEVLRENSNVYSIDTSVGNKSKIPSPVEWVLLSLGILSAN